jgi:uncharacterized protein
VRHSRPGLALSIIVAVVVCGAGGFFFSQTVAASNHVHSSVKQSGSAAHTVTVGGHGEVNLAPDQATITVGATTNAQTAKQALSQNADTLQAITTAIEAVGVPPSHIQTTNLSLYYDSDHLVYVVDHELTVKIDNVSNVGAVLDAAVGAGANNSWGVSFGLKDSTAARNQALQAAVRDARSKADSIGSSIGSSISGVQSVTESSANVQPPIRFAAAAPAQSSGSTSVQPGELTISADVTVVYTFG